MICAKNSENIFKFVKVTHTILYSFPDTVYIFFKLTLHEAQVLDIDVI